MPIDLTLLRRVERRVRNVNILHLVQIYISASGILKLRLEAAVH